MSGRNGDGVSPAAVPPIGERIRQERIRKGVSARGLAREIGVSASLISQIETDKSQPSVSTLYAITTALGISVEDIFNAVDEGPVADNVLGGGASDEAAGTAGDAAIGAGPEGDAVGDEGEGVAAVPAAAAVQMAAAGLVASAGQSGAGQVRSADPPGSAVDALQLLGANRRRVGPIVRAAEREVLTLDSGVTWELLGQVPDAHTEFLRITYQPGGSSSSLGLLMRHSGTEYGYVLRGELVVTLGFDEHRLTAGDSVCFDSSTPHSYRNDGTEPAVGIWFVLERSG